MIPEIDFLPESYKLARERRKRKQWRLMAMFVALALIAAGSIRQRQICSALADMRDRMHTNVERLRSQVKGAPELNDELTRLTAQANVITFLRSKLPPSRIMQVVSNALPEHVTLTQCKMGIELLPKRPSSASGRRDVPPASPDAKPAEKLPAQKDLDDLLKRSDESALFVELSGVAPDDVAIAQYLAALTDSGLFADITLQFTDQLAMSDHLVRRFGARLRLNKVEPWRVRKTEPRSGDAPSATEVSPTAMTHDEIRRPT